MKLRAALILSVCLLFSIAGHAQTTVKGNITTGGADCTVATNCVSSAVSPTVGGASFTLSGTFSSTQQFEGSGDYSTTWVALSVTPTNSTTTVTSATAAGTWTANVAGLTNIRVRSSSYSSGTVVVTINTSAASARTNGGGGASSAAVAPNQLNFYASPNCGTQANCFPLSLTADNSTNLATLFAASNASTVVGNPVDIRTGAASSGSNGNVASLVTNATNYPGDKTYVIYTDVAATSATVADSSGTNSYSLILGSLPTFAVYSSSAASVFNNVTVTPNISDFSTTAVISVPSATTNSAAVTNAGTGTASPTVTMTGVPANSMVIAACRFGNFASGTLTSTNGTLRTYTASSLAGSGVIGLAVWATYSAAGGTVVSGGTTQNTTNWNCLAFSVAGGGGTQANPVIDIARGYYYYSSGMNPTIPTTLRCEPGTFLDYTGSAHAVDLGPIGGYAAGQGSWVPSMIIDGCTFVGGANMTEGIVMQPNVTVVGFRNNNLIDFGNSTAYMFYGTCENWDIELGPQNRVVVDDFTPRPIFSENNGPFNSGNCPASADENSFARIHDNSFYCEQGRGQSATGLGCTTAQTAVGFIIDSAHSIFSRNFMSRFSPNLLFRCTEGVNFCVGNSVDNNVFEPANGPSSNLPVIQYSTGVDQLEVTHNLIFMQNISGDALLGPVSGTDVLTDARVSTNQVGRLPSGAALIVENNVSGNTGNQAWQNGCAYGTNLGPNAPCLLLHTAGGSINAWTEIVDADGLGLQGSTSGTATVTPPAVAGTATNPILITNSLQLPTGTVYNWNADTGLSRDAAAVVDVGNGTAGNTSGTLKATVLNGRTTNSISNFNQAAQSQTVVSATEYYLTRSDLDMPATYTTAIAAGTTMRWRIALNKTAAGTGTFQILLKKGTNGSTADTSIVTQTIGTQTAAADNMEADIQLTWTSATAAYWTIIPRQSAASGTGFGLVYPAVAAQFNGTISGQTTTTASDKYGISVIFTTGTPTFIATEVSAQAFGVN